MMLWKHVLVREAVLAGDPEVDVDDLYLRLIVDVLHVDILQQVQVVYVIPPRFVLRSPLVHGPYVPPQDLVHQLSKRAANRQREAERGRERKSVLDSDQAWDEVVRSEDGMSGSGVRLRAPTWTRSS